MVYLTVLVASLIVVVIGVSALLAVRLQHRVAVGTHRATEARLHARSAVDRALLRLAGDDRWRRTYTHDQWTQGVKLNGATLSFKLVDADDANLSDDPAERVWLHGRANLKITQRQARVMLAPKWRLEGANMLRNAGLAQGTHHWWSEDSDARVRYSDSDGYDGSGCLHVAGRDRAWVGLNQTVTDRLRKNTAYYLEAWVRVPEDEADIKLQLHVRGDDGNQQWAAITPVSVEEQWTRVAGTVTPQWSGTLQHGAWEIETDSDTPAFVVDRPALIPDVHRHEMTPVPGTWRQVVQ